ncbi:MAG: hypothetical protein LBK99_01175 [Opitutaceae bacterium]|nr:hypothetical protein [Opitutaceae bacterium]
MTAARSSGSAGREGGRVAQSVRVSARHGRYLELEDGTTFVPIGLNLSFPRFVQNEEEGLALYESWLRELAANGGNFFRLWLGHPFFDVEPERAGEFDEAAAGRLGRVLGLAGSPGLRVKVTLEHFRSLETAPVAEIFPGAAQFARGRYHRSRGGPADTMDAFWQGPEARAFYLKKLDWLAERFSAERYPAVAAWELWNEIDASQGRGQEDWTERMLPELRKRFPRCLMLQSLGSFSGGYVEAAYHWLCGLPGNDVVQVHRYLDPGAEWEVCRGPVDVLAADAVRTLREWSAAAGGPARPVLLAEGGAVEAHHAGPSSLYERDCEGIILHDVLFAPFFAGAAGCGQMWHWDVYVARHRLWWHFGRFARAIAGFDPVAEGAEPVFWETPRLRAYALRGGNVSLIWLRDRRCDWKSELDAGRAAVPVVGECLCLPPGFAVSASVKFYDPWGDCGWVDHGRLNGEAGFALPAFTRSLVIRLMTGRQ